MKFKKTFIRGFLIFLILLALVNTLPQTPITPLILPQAFASTTIFSTGFEETANTAATTPVLSWNNSVNAYTHEPSTSFGTYTGYTNNLYALFSPGSASVCNSGAGGGSSAVQYTNTTTPVNVGGSLSGNYYIAVDMVYGGVYQGGYNESSAGFSSVAFNTYGKGPSATVGKLINVSVTAPNNAITFTIAVPGAGFPVTDSPFNGNGGGKTREPSGIAFQYYRVFISTYSDAAHFAGSGVDYFNISAPNPTGSPLKYTQTFTILSLTTSTVPLNAGGFNTLADQPGAHHGFGTISQCDGYWSAAAGEGKNSIYAVTSENPHGGSNSFMMGLSDLVYDKVSSNVKVYGGGGSAASIPYGNTGNLLTFTTWIRIGGTYSGGVGTGMCANDGGVNTPFMSLMGDNLIYQCVGTAGAGTWKYQTTGVTLTGTLFLSLKTWHQITQIWDLSTSGQVSIYDLQIDGVTPSFINSGASPWTGVPTYEANSHGPLQGVNGYTFANCLVASQYAAHPERCVWGWSFWPNSQQAGMVSRATRYNVPSAAADNGGYVQLDDMSITTGNKVATITSCATLAGTTGTFPSSSPTLIITGGITNYTYPASTATSGTYQPPQRKQIDANGVTWNFHSDGTNAVLNGTSIGISAVDEVNFAVYWNGTYGYYIRVKTSAGAGVYFRPMDLNANKTITYRRLPDNVLMAESTITTQTVTLVNIGVDSAGYPWATYVNSTYGSFALRSPWNNGTFATLTAGNSAAYVALGGIYHKIGVTANSNLIVQPVALSAQKMYFVLGYSAKSVNGTLYDGSWGAIEQPFGATGVLTNTALFSASAYGDIVGLAANNVITGADYLHFVTRSAAGVWGTKVALATVGASSEKQAPALTSDNYGSFHVFITGYPNNGSISHFAISPNGTVSARQDITFQPDNHMLNYTLTVTPDRSTHDSNSIGIEWSNSKALSGGGSKGTIVRAMRLIVSQTGYSAEVQMHGSNVVDLAYSSTTAGIVELTNATGPHNQTIGADSTTTFTGQTLATDSLRAFWGNRLVNSTHSIILVGSMIEHMHSEIYCTLYTFKNAEAATLAAHPSSFGLTSANGTVNSGFLYNQAVIVANGTTVLSSAFYAGVNVAGSNSFAPITTTTPTFNLQVTSSFTLVFYDRRGNVVTPTAINMTTPNGNETQFTAYVFGQVPYGTYYMNSTTVQGQNRACASWPPDCDLLSPQYSINSTNPVWTITLFYDPFPCGSFSFTPKAFGCFVPFSVQVGATVTAVASVSVGVYLRRKHG